MPRAKLDRCHLVPTPAGGFFRVTSRPQPFDPSDPPPPISDRQGEPDDAGRWDAPDGSFRTLYCATEPEGAIGEKLAAFTLRPELAVRIEAFLEEEPDEEFVGDQLIPPLEAEDIQGLGWQLAWAPSKPSCDLLDLNHISSYLALTPAVIDLVFASGLRWFDRHAVLSEKRNFTRRVAGRIRESAQLPDGSLAISGLRYESRLPPAWECWALWEPLPLDTSEPDTETISIDHPALRRAARLIGVQLLG
jgi:hypothetical protein